MSNGPEILYTAEATAVGGREGHSRTSDGRLDVDLDVPTEMGGTCGPGTNPEQVLARAGPPASSRRCSGSPSLARST